MCFELVLEIWVGHHAQVCGDCNQRIPFGTALHTFPSHYCLKVLIEVICQELWVRLHFCFLFISVSLFACASSQALAAEVASPLPQSGPDPVQFRGCFSAVQNVA